MARNILTVKAHGRSYRVYNQPGHGSGLAPSKVVRCAKLGVPYERALLDHIHGLGLTGVAVDAGANVGNHTMWLARMCGLHVAAFEPLVHSELAANLTLNELWEQVDVYPIALGDDDAKATLVADGQLRLDDDGDISVRTLDLYDLQDVSMIKIDVEGMEAHVLRGAQRTIERCRPVIFAEEWTKVEHDQIAEVLEPWGYTMTYLFTGKEAATPMGKWEHGAS